MDQQKRNMVIHMIEVFKWIAVGHSKFLHNFLHNFYISSVQMMYM